jgi:predicted HAD superfamily Cof-like phosphohydrolase
MNKQIEMMREFHKAFGHPVDEGYLINNISFVKLRTKLHSEECSELNEELWDAVITDKEISPNLLKEGADLLYVLLGTFVSLGLGDQLIEAFERVHLSNMSKLDEAGRPIYREDGKVMKGPNYKPPYLDDLLMNDEDRYPGMIEET